TTPGPRGWAHTASGRTTPASRPGPPRRRPPGGPPRRPRRGCRGVHLVDGRDGLRLGPGAPGARAAAAAMAAEAVKEVEATDQVLAAVDRKAAEVRRQIAELKAAPRSALEEVNAARAAQVAALTGQLGGLNVERGRAMDGVIAEARKRVTE